MKDIKYLILFFCLFFLGCIKCIDITTPKTLKQDVANRIIIDKIDIDEEYNIASIDDFVIGIVMFEETGRPNIDKSNTVIGGHSGYGSNAYFNDLNKLNKDDKIKLFYDNKEYIYLVDEIKMVEDTDLSVLNNKDKSMVTIITCNIKDTSKRIVVVSYLEKIIDM